MDDPVAATLVRVPAGRVALSDRRTRSQWTVEVADFHLGEAAVTEGQYRAVVGTGPVGTVGGGGSSDADSRLPMVEVSWWDAVRFCNALSERAGLPPTYRVDVAAGRIEWDTGAAGYRLPTEAEWEYACRAGTSGPRYGPIDEIAWYRDNSGDRRRPVGGRRPNPWGLYDMIGNVWDWCWDHYDPQVYGDYRVLRGGGWADPHWSCRASVRRRSHPAYAIDDVGFRVARAA
ncbi:MULTISPECIES: formylglycine-generating enzyme family protein [unclassified Solwaraspora]|uniref:formylglycine-generating enzyme family protein n=1 Tax=unclassified Solwaraspora TaxID=2627926 RepID=UPI00259B9F53|nr:SUMF1/EgtB/PvdO family nonheme iron enzyme [Solwaraspora sp. WMMA2056]WJK38859.1 SUMF1/EgtB/PvdO family nonheme iron enzyme [Solwaraspora sp. WMMA2056]